jgi:hypothetical protein
MAKRKAMADDPEAQAESNGYKRWAHREKDSTRDNGKHNKKVQFSHAADSNSRIHTEHPDSRSQATSGSFDGRLAPGSDIFSPAALPGNPEPRHKKKRRRACISCRKWKTKCDESNPICSHCQAYQPPCPYPNPEYQREQKYREAERINRRRMRAHIKNLEQ